MFANNLDIETPGEYFRLPVGAPHATFFHPFGSTQWEANSGIAVGPLGEVPFPRRSWTTGLSLVQLPLPLILGKPGQITQGSTWPLPDTEREFVGGWPRLCFLDEVDMPWPTRLDQLDLDDCHTLALFADLQVDLYDHPARAEQKLRDLLGPNVRTSLQTNGPTLFPGSLIGENEGIIIVVVSGTTNFTQLACQALYSLIGPVSNAYYGTIPLWQSAALDLQRRVFQFVADQTKPILIVGHSYGGAVSCVMAARYLLKTPARDVRLLTFGCPRPGDAKLVGWLRGMRQLHIRNLFDPVPGVPPLPLELGPLYPIIPVPVLVGWAKFVSTENFRMYSAQDQFVVGGPSPDLFQQVAICVLRALFHQDIPDFPDHDMQAYLRNVRCLPVVIDLDIALALAVDVGEAIRLFADVAVDGQAVNAIALAGDVAVDGQVVNAIALAGDVAVDGQTIVPIPLSADLAVDVEFSTKGPLLARESPLFDDNMA